MRQFIEPVIEPLPAGAPVPLANDELTPVRPAPTPAGVERRRRERRQRGRGDDEEQARKDCQAPGRA